MFHFTSHHVPTINKCIVTLYRNCDIRLSLRSDKEKCPLCQYNILNDEALSRNTKVILSHMKSGIFARGMQMLQNIRRNAIRISPFPPNVTRHGDCHIWLSIVVKRSYFRSAINHKTFVAIVKARTARPVPVLSAQLLIGLA
jgi:hypothetical protein